MPIRRQDILVLLSHWLGYSKWRNRQFRRQHRPVTRILTFHDIPSQTAGLFRAKMQWLRSNTNVISLDDFFEGRLDVNQQNVIVTFDDGYTNWARIAAPVLVEIGVPATFFISSGLIGLTGELEADFIRRRLRLDPSVTSALSREDVLRMAEAGFHFGGHTCNHVNLAETRDLAVARREIETDRTNIQALTNKPARYFAYPYGAFENKAFNIAALVEQSGYRGAVTVRSGLNDASSPAFLLSRELTSAAMPLVVFKARVSGAYDGVKALKRYFNRG